MLHTLNLSLLNILRTFLHGQRDFEWSYFVEALRDSIGFKIKVYTLVFIK